MQEHRVEISFRPTISLVVPVFNGAATLRDLVSRADSVLGELVDSHEFVFVDDGSSDDSWSVLETLSARRADIRAFRLMRNFGQHNALMCGFKHCRGGFVVTIDDDLQNPPEEIPKLYKEISAGNHDVVFGYFDERKHGFLRNLSSRAARWLLSRSIERLNPYYSNFRIIRRSVVDVIVEQDDDFLFTDGIITWITDRTAHVAVEHSERSVGRSNYTFSRLVGYFLVSIFTFTVLPLRVLAVTGSILSLGGFVLGAYYMVNKLMGNLTQEGFAGIIVSVLVIGGVQLLALAVIGEYVGKVFLKQSRKPQFLIRERCGQAHAEHSSLRRDEKGLRGIESNQ